MLAERHGDRGEVVARRAVFEHVAARAEGVLRHRAEMAELRAVLLRPLRRRDEIVLRKAGATLGVGARPGIAAVAADDGGREAGFDRHDGEDDRQDLARAAVVEGRAEARIDAEPGRDQLVMGVDVVRAAHDHAVDVLVGQAGFVERVLDGLFQERQRIRADLAEPALAGADDGVFVPQRTHARAS